MDVPPHADRLTIAHRTLRDGTAFIGTTPRRAALAGAPDGNLLGDMVDIRLVGNGLRELDRFLGVLIEEVARRIGPAAHDVHAFGRLRNTANKLRLVRAMMHVDTPDHRWLQAVGRLRICLHHCGGEVRASGYSAELAFAGCRIVAAPGSDPSRRRVVLTSDALGRISRAYRRLGDELVAEWKGWVPAAP